MSRKCRALPWRGGGSRLRGSGADRLGGGRLWQSVGVPTLRNRFNLRCNKHNLSFAIFNLSKACCSACCCSLLLEVPTVPVPIRANPSKDGFLERVPTCPVARMPEIKQRVALLAKRTYVLYPTAFCSWCRVCLLLAAILLPPSFSFPHTVFSSSFVHSFH